MRTISILSLAALLTLVTAPAFAGSLTLSGGTAQWQSTDCTEPSMPPSLLAMNSEAEAGQMNTVMENYNAYADNMQAYMNCLSKEAEKDSNLASQTVAQSASAQITAAQNKVAGLHAAVSAKQK